MYLGIPLSATLSIAHAYLPPHPAPTYISVIYGADVNSVLLIGLVPVIPACLIAGILLSKFFKKPDVKPPVGLHEEKHFEKSELPGLGISIFTMLIPVLLMLFGAIAMIILIIAAGGAFSRLSDMYSIQYKEFSLKVFSSIRSEILLLKKIRKM